MLNIELAHYLSEQPLVFLLLLFVCGVLAWQVPGAAIRVLLRIGLVRRVYDSEKIRWPISIDPWFLWTLHASCLFRGEWFCSRTRKGFPWCSPGFCAFGAFRNLPHVIKWEKGRLLPRRWGFRILGLEIGDRG